MFEMIKQFFAGLEEQAPLQSPVPHGSSEYNILETKVGYHFSDQKLLKQALTHKSSTKPETDHHGLTSNERLEFLGDAILDFLVTEELYLRYLDFTEGQLSKMKSLLVSRKILGVLAERIQLESFVIKGRSEKKNSNNHKNSIGSNAFEALIGAIYLDSDVETTRKMLARLLYPSIESFLNDVENHNYKSRILELSQSEGFGIPQYPLISEQGPDHMKQFKTAIEVGGVQLGIGIGKNKKEAQQEAARIAVKKFDNEFILKAQKG